VETVFASLPEYLVACLILAGAQAVYVLLGFGAGMVAVGLLALVPAAMLGAFVGDRIHLRIDEATFRRMVSVALVVIGAVLLAHRL